MTGFWCCHACAATKIEGPGSAVMGDREFFNLPFPDLDRVLKELASQITLA
jgi:hypothetical protein